MQVSLQVVGRPMLCGAITSRGLRESKVVPSIPFETQASVQLRYNVSGDCTAGHERVSGWQRSEEGGGESQFSTVMALLWPMCPCRAYDFH